MWVKMLIKTFINKYKRLGKEKEVSPDGYSATTAYLTTCEKFRISPTPMGIVRWDGAPNEINVENYRMGKKYAMALSNSMKYLKTEKLNLQSNNLGGNGSMAILSNLSDRLSDLNLSNNDMGDGAMPKLVEWLVKFPGKCSLKFLNLSGNKLSDKSLFNLCEALVISNPPMRDLNLSHNKMEGEASKALGEFINNASNLKILKLQWNKIQGEGAIHLLSCIGNSKSIRNLDISWNILGSKGPKTEELITALAGVVNKGVLRHLDISYNSIKHEE